MVSKPYVDRVAIIMKPHVDKVQVALSPYTKDVVHACGNFMQSATTHRQKVQPFLRLVYLLFQKRKREKKFIVRRSNTHC